MSREPSNRFAELLTKAGKDRRSKCQKKKANISVLNFARVKPKTAEKFEREGLTKEHPFEGPYVDLDIIKQHAFACFSKSEDQYKCNIILKSLTGPIAEVSLPTLTNKTTILVHFDPKPPAEDIASEEQSTSLSLAKFVSPAYVPSSAKTTSSIGSLQVDNTRTITESGFRPRNRPKPVLDDLIEVGK